MRCQKHQRKQMIVMKRISLIIIAATVLCGASAWAQDVNEAFNLSNTGPQGTARSMGFGNALGSVGGDFASIAVNPAGLGIYRSSELSFTPSLKMDGSKSTYSGNSTMDNNLNFNFNHWGMVFTNAAKGKRYERRKWKSVAFAIGMNKTADFNRNYSYAGINKTSSASQAMESDANQNPGNYNIPGTLGFMGYQGYLLNYDSSTGKYHSIVPFQNGINQQKTAQIRGAINELDLSLGGNYMEHLLLGVTLGIPVINYQVNSTYTESLGPGNMGNSDGFSSFSYGNNLNITGSGLNLKLGLIWKINDYLRIGGAIHTPTYYTISENSTPSLYSTVNGGYNAIDNSFANQTNRFDYNLTTPWKSVLSGTFLFGKVGFVTADFEHVNYNTMRYTYPTGYDNNGATFQYDETLMNQQIKNTYQAANNIRIGGEIKLGALMLRAGYGFYGNPYKSSQPSMTRNDISCGIGFHFHSFFTDLGLVHSMYSVSQQPYTIDYSGVVTSTSPATIPTAKIDYSLNNVAWTIGWKFH